MDTELLIKCDVETTEVEGFRGAGGLLADCQPWVPCEVRSTSKGLEFVRILGSAQHVLEFIDPTQPLTTSRAKSESK